MLSAVRRLALGGIGASDAHVHSLAGVGSAVYGKFAVALQHHVVRVGHGHLQSAIVAEDGSAYRACEHRGTLLVRMHGVGQQLRISIERLVEVDELRLSHARHGLYSLLNLLVPLLRAALEARMVVGDGREERDEHPTLRVLLAQSVDKSQVVAHEFVAIERPVARVGVVHSEVDDGDVALESLCLRPFLLLCVRTMAVAQQRGARLSEVAHLISIAKHLLQLRRIRLGSRVGESHAVCDAVADTRHARLFEVNAFRHTRIDCERKRKQHGECKRKNTLVGVHDVCWVFDMFISRWFQVDIYKNNADSYKDNAYNYKKKEEFR